MNVAGCAEVQRKSTINNLVVAMVALTVIAATAMLYLFDPLQHRFYPVCPFHALTGLHCPGCGALRALHALTHGHVLAAFHLNALLLVTLPLLGLATARATWRRQPLGHLAIPANWIWTYVAVTAAFWILRNVPLYPFTLLAP